MEAVSGVRNHASFRTRKFYLLLVSGLLSFAGWAFLFSYCAKLWRPNAQCIYKNTAKFDTGARRPSATTSVYIDIWFALALMAALDALAIVLNFNRALIHQFHYFVSLRMMALAFIISAALALLYDNESGTSWGYSAGILLLCALSYVIFVLIHQKLHRLLPKREIGLSPGSFQQFTQHVCSFDTSWRQAISLAAINGLVGLALTALVPARWSVFNPVVHITWEVTFLGLMGTKQTPRYILFATPFVQASTFTDWGLRQMISAPRLVLTPSTFLAVMITGRLLLDLHLWTMFHHRRDFCWARNHALFPTWRLVLVFTAMLLVEFMGVPVVTFVKPISVVLLHAAGVLVFLVPACYGLSFGVRT